MLGKDIVSNEVFCSPGTLQNDTQPMSEAWSSNVKNYKWATFGLDTTEPHLIVFGETWGVWQWQNQYIFPGPMKKVLSLAF